VSAVRSSLVCFVQCTLVRLDLTAGPARNARTAVPDEQSLAADGTRRFTWTEVSFGEYVCKDGSSIAGILDYQPYDASLDKPCDDALPCSSECAVYRQYCPTVDECTSRKDTGEGQRFARYVTALYWAFMTMTTVGYGDIPAGTLYEKATAVFGMLVGGFIFGLIVGSLGEMARKSNPGDSFRTKKISQLSAYLNCRGVTPDLVRRIRLYFQVHAALTHSRDSASPCVTVPRGGRDSACLTPCD
jgi:hypothetical protein